MIYPGTEVRLTGQQFPVSSFLPFLKMGAMFPFFQSLGTSPDCSDIMEIYQTIPSRLQDNLFGPVDLFLFSFLRQSGA